MKTFIPILFSLVLLSCSVKETKKEPQTTQPIIAKVNETTNEITIHKKVLKKTFKDGGQIMNFKVKKFADGYNLIRLGKNAKGENTSEFVPLELKPGGGLILKSPIWFIVCNSTCEYRPDVSGFCKANYQKSECQCNGESNCNFGGVAGIPNDIAIIVAN